MEKSKSIGLTLRKGAWTYEEDKLLKACIEKYGDGKWHLVPQRAGLNRCRKSCRLRWLNYLNPTINRERFSEDEVDMILRLHKLLGNRWSLIAARLPGRTANDVKNYWNTHLLKKVVSNKEEEKKAANFPKESMKSHEIIKPRPITLSSRSPWLNGKHSFVEPIVEVLTKDGTFGKESVIESGILQINGEGDCALEDLLNASNEKIGACSLLQEERKSMLEFSNIDNLFIEGSSTISDLYWDSNFCEFDYLDIFN